MPALRTVARNATPAAGRPRSRMFLIARRIAARLEPRTAQAFLAAVTKLQSQIDEAELRSALAGGHVASIEAAVATGGNLMTILGDGVLERALRDASTATGRAGAQVLTGVRGLSVRFNAMDPRVVLFAREQVGELIVAVDEDVRAAVRIVVALGQEQGLTLTQQARAIREVVGLPPNWANAPLNLRKDILAGDVAAATGRRLSAADKAQIRKRIAKGTIDEAFLNRMQTRYTESLISLRSQTIARTENHRAANNGQREGWKQAVEQGALPKTLRRHIIVVPDDRLRATHAAVPGLNPDGRELDEFFDTPMGRMLQPPWEPSCRCGVGLMFPGLKGML